jgi:hypothetical protein
VKLTIGPHGVHRDSFTLTLLPVETYLRRNAYLECGNGALHILTRTKLNANRFDFLAEGVDIFTLRIVTAVWRRLLRDDCCGMSGD